MFTVVSSQSVNFKVVLKTSVIFVKFGTKLFSSNDFFFCKLDRMVDSTPNINNNRIPSEQQNLIKVSPYYATYYHIISQESSSPNSCDQKVSNLEK